MRLSNRVLWFAVAAGVAVAGEAGAQSTATLNGRATDESGAPLSGVQIVVTHQVTGVVNGALSQSDGRFTVTLRPGGPYRIEARMIGYGLQVVDDLTLAPQDNRTLDFRLSQEAIAIDALEVFATRAIERKTPVAFSDVKKVQIQNQLGSRDLPLVLNVTPSVYATQAGGGAGDARINVRGFSQRNTAVMINGVPVNDMENGWVYWSNWDGLGDAATSIQLQRGLSAVNLATPSIGGTLNVITDPSSQHAGVSYKQEFGLGSLEVGSGDWGFGTNMLKETLVFRTGEISGFALTGSVVRKTGSGMFSGYTGGDATWTDAWAYYLAAAYQVSSRNRIELYAVGAPQRHGQNLYKLNIASYSHEFASSLKGYSPEALADIPEVGRWASPNLNRVSSSYTGKQYASSGPGAGTFDRYDPNYINERENYFHKPQVNLNWYSFFGNGLTLSTVAYYSGGSGGGTGTYGSLVWDYTYQQRIPDWDGTIARNQASATGSTGILRNSVNNQWTLGAISKLRKDYPSGWTAEVGLDWRTAQVEHYREVRDLLGGAYYNDCFGGCSSAFWSQAEQNRGLGDRIDYDGENSIDWLGAYVQAEKATLDGSFYGMFGWAQNAYTTKDFFKDDGTGNPLVLESGNLRGFQVKGGAVRNVSDEWSVFGNAGYVSKVPILDGAIDDVNDVKVTDPKNEKFLSFEAGVRYRSMNRGVSFDANLYHTTWRDRTNNMFVRDLFGTGEDGLVRLLGVDARHMGIELQGAVQPSELVRIDAAASIGHWKYLDDVQGTFISGDQQVSDTYNFYINGLKVADAPQSQVAYAVSVFPIDGLYLQGVGKTFGNHYAEFDPFDRTEQAEAGIQSWQPPGYTVFDLHASYRLGDILRVWNGADLRLFANVYNLTDKMYIQDAVDNSAFNDFDGDHDADDAEVYLGIPRYINIGFQISF